MVEMSHSRRSGERQRSGIAVESRLYPRSPSSLCSCCAVVLSDATALLQPASALMSPLKASLSLGVSRWIQSRGTSCQFPAVLGYRTIRYYAPYYVIATYYVILLQTNYGTDFHRTTPVLKYETETFYCAVL